MFSTVEFLIFSVLKTFLVKIRQREMNASNMNQVVIKFNSTLNTLYIFVYTYLVRTFLLRYSKYLCEQDLEIMYFIRQIQASCSSRQFTQCFDACTHREALFYYRWGMVYHFLSYLSVIVALSASKTQDQDLMEQLYFYDYIRAMVINVFMLCKHTRGSRLFALNKILTFGSIWR